MDPISRPPSLPLMASHPTPKAQESEKQISPPTHVRRASRFANFFSLPREIRDQVYTFALFDSRQRTWTGSWKPSPASHRINLFLASHRLHDEATYVFYSSQTFRVFPIQDYTRIPSVRALTPRHRPLVTSIELILGSSWTRPPKSWDVTDRMGLEGMTHVRTLKIFVQCDPSHPSFEGFRVSRDFYTIFAGARLREILRRLPDLKHVEFDGYPSVEKDGSLMTRLLSEARQAKKEIVYGPMRRWREETINELDLNAFAALSIQEDIRTDEVMSCTA